MENVILFELEEIRDDSNIFKELKERKIFFSYFQVDQKYYLIIFAQQRFDPDFIYESVTQIKELNTKQRRIRSYRGFFLYALEIMEQGNSYQILETNLKPYFWTKVKSIINQNKRGELVEFLFDNTPNLIELQNQVEFLQERIKKLEQNSVDSSNFVSIKNISDEEVLEIFKLSQESNMSYKEFFEGIGSKTLYQLKGYRINFNNLKRTQIFKRFKNKLLFD